MAENTPDLHWVQKETKAAGLQITKISSLMISWDTAALY